MSRKLRPEKLRPSGCLENSDPKNKTYLHRVNAASRLVYCSLMQWHYHNLPRKEKQFIVSRKLSAEKRKNSLQCQIRATIMKIILNMHSYRFFFSLWYKPSLYPQRVVSLESRGVLRYGFLYKCRAGVTRQLTTIAMFPVTSRAGHEGLFISVVGKNTT